MDLKEIQNLIKFVAKSGVSEVSLEQGEFKITIKAENEIEQQVVLQQPNVQALPAQAMMPQAVAPIQEVPVAQAPAQTNAEDDSNYITVKSPMIGTFYRKPAPDKDVFVNVGDTINPGDVICIIEAMKLFNEIESEVSGKIVKVLVDESTPVEYDQPLFIVDPS